MVDDDNIVVASNYRMLGVGFQLSAKQLTSSIEVDADERPKKLTAIPFYFLASHAAELFLKSALLKRGVSENLLKKFDYRHNLEALLNALKEKGVPISGNTESVVLGLSEQHKSHQLRYTVFMDDGKPTYWPPLSYVFSTLEELLMLTRISTHSV